VRSWRRVCLSDALVMIFLMPPSLNCSRRGCVRRGTDSDETIRKRLALAQAEMKYWPEYDYVMKAADLTTTSDRARRLLSPRSAAQHVWRRKVTMATKRTILLESRVPSQRISPPI